MLSGLWSMVPLLLCCLFLLLFLMVCWFVRHSYFSSDLCLYKGYSFLSDFHSDDNDDFDALCTNLSTAKHLVRFPCCQDAIIIIIMNT